MQPKNLNNLKISERQGNTKPVSAPSKSSTIRARRWCLTWNNYTIEDYEELKTFCELNCGVFRLGKEGKEKTPHIQGYLEFKNQKRFSALHKRFPKVHWEKARGTKSQNLKYCSKEGDFDKNLTFQEKLHQTILDAEYGNVVWKDWQQKVLDFCATKPDSRTIYWVFDKKGNRGKSFLAKYLFLKYDVVLADGKKDNVFNQTKLCLENEKIPRIILLDVPRYSVDYINYGVLEALKNGLIYSGKYEGGAFAFPHPHVIVFANVAPEMHKMSRDRWIVDELAD